MKAVYQVTNSFIFISILVAFTVFFSCESRNESLHKNYIIKKDSISIWIKKSKDKSIPIEQRTSLLARAYNYSTNFKSDSIKNQHLLKIAFQSLLLSDSILFRKTNNKAYDLSKKTNDTSRLAETHWNYGSFFSKKEVQDSAYYHFYEAHKLYERIGNNYYSAKMLYNMAIIQSNIKDYTGSEKIVIKAIAKFKPLQKNLPLYRAYNLLGIIHKELEEYERSVFYHNEALICLKKINDNNSYKEGSYNNLSLVYRKWKDYDKAISYVEKALANGNIKTKNPKLYARLIDNLAYNKFLKGNIDTIYLQKEFHKSLSLRDSLNDTSGIIINKLHLAEYFAKFNDTAKAINCALEAKKLAKKINNNRDCLEALKLLSEIDNNNSTKHLNNYISLGDSLKKEERRIRNKFTRIRFETDEYVAETKRLAQQKIWILSLSLTSVVLLSLLYFLVRQRAKNKELLFDTEQQKSNEEIYKLMLKQQANLEKGRLDERHRISEELHDGVLGKLFGTRMGMGFLDINGDLKTTEQYNSYINELHDIEKEIRTISHELKSELLAKNNSFLELVENLIQSQSKLGDFSYSLVYEDSKFHENFDENTKINIYRIIQEALMNVTKYAKANYVNIGFEVLDKFLNLTIDDNGIGFVLNKNNEGIGLMNIKSRAQKLGGNFTLKSSKNTGTSLIIKIPL